MLAKKQFGQNFLQSDSALNKIITAGEITPGELILEIGPGQGALTAKLLSAGAKVIAIEIDQDLITILENKFATELANGQLYLINGDVLQTDVMALTKNQPYKLIANIPYYITGAILEYFLQKMPQPLMAILLVQKEVADRIIAKDNKESILSLSVKVFGRPHYIATVKAGSFFPKPKIDSAIIKIDHIHKKLNDKQLDDFFHLIKQAFSSKRKQLKNNLPDLKTKLENCQINLTSRAEDLTLDQWLKIITTY